MHPAQNIRSLEIKFEATGEKHLLNSFGISSPDVAISIDSKATNCRFDEWVTTSFENLGRDFTLCATLEDETLRITGSGIANAFVGDAFFESWGNFLNKLSSFESGRVLELGSRARSALTRRGQIPERFEYIGMDILPGPNVDAVGDAHELEKIFGRDRFVAVFSLSVFEHLAMPWKVALEINRVLVTHGIAYTMSHQTWPIHEEPWDFWRYSRNTWQTIFNSATGFEVLESAHGDPAIIHSRFSHPATRELPEAKAYLGSSVIVRKISDTELQWPVPLHQASTGQYPKGEMTAPPR